MRILIAELPRLVRDVVRDAIGAEADMQIVDEGVETGALVERVGHERPDVVVVMAASSTPPPVCAELLGRYPGTAVVALEDGGHRASVYALRPTRSRVAELSRTRLVRAIRRAATPPTWHARIAESTAALTDATAPAAGRDEQGSLTREMPST